MVRRSPSPVLPRTGTPVRGRLAVRRADPRPRPHRAGRASKVGQPRAFLSAIVPAPDARPGPDRPPRAWSPAIRTRIPRNVQPMRCPQARVAPAPKRRRRSRNGRAPHPATGLLPVRRAADCAAGAAGHASRRCRCRGVQPSPHRLPAALPLGLQPDRVRLLQAQGTAAQGRRALRRRPPGRHRPHPRHLFANPMPQLLQGRRL